MDWIAPFKLGKRSVRVLSIISLLNGVAALAGSRHELTRAQSHDSARVVKQKWERCWRLPAERKLAAAKRLGQGLSFKRSSSGTSFEPKSAVSILSQPLHALHLVLVQDRTPSLALQSR